jgi:hypothetical protein
MGFDFDILRSDDSDDREREREREFCRKEDEGRNYIQI